MKITIGDFLITRLKEVGIEHLIGVPGDFNLQFLEQLKEHDGIRFVGASNELNAAYAADGYARERGIAAFLVTYGVGDLGALPGVAGSMAEHIPVIAISGTPPQFIVKHNFKVHHSMGDGDYDNVKNAYDEFTVSRGFITQENAQEEIDRLIRMALLHKKPVNIQIPSNITYLEIDWDEEPLKPLKHVSDAERLEAMAQDLLERFEKATNPIVLVDIDMDRLDIAEEILAFIEKTKTPFVTLSTGKAILNENHGLYLGVYNGDQSDEGIQEKVETSDFLLTVSPRFIEQNSGKYTSDLPEEHLIRLGRDHSFVGTDVYEGVAVKDILHRFIDNVKENNAEIPAKTKEEMTVEIQKDKALDHKHLWQQIQGFLQEDDIIYAETGSSSQALAKIQMPTGVKFIASQIWGAIGHMLPALYGSLLSNNNRRQLLFIGDGSFQVTSAALSRILYEELNPIIVLINNDGYTIERYIMGMKEAYNDIPKWEYHKLPDVMCPGHKMKVFNCKTQEELRDALEAVKDVQHGAFIEVHLDPYDAPEALKKFGPGVAEFNYGDRGPDNEEPEEN